jgi:hypothetical protein
MLSTKAILLENIYYKMLTLLPGDVIMIPLPTTIFLTWYINSVINDVISAGKILWNPLLFEILEIKDCSLRSAAAACTYTFSTQSQARQFSSHLPSSDSKFGSRMVRDAQADNQHRLTPCNGCAKDDLI